MEEGLRSVHAHMRELGLAALAHANWHAHCVSPDNDYWAELSVIQAAHATEILIKARIAQEHPLLIFETLPKPATQSAMPLSVADLIENGRTYQYADLPHRLWATTGVELADVDRYRAFGRLRNAIQHFTAPPRDVTQETLEFIFEVVDPFINQCWGLFAIDHNEDYEPYSVFVPALVRRGIRFLVSPEMLDHLEYAELDWPQDGAYRSEMEKRFAVAPK